MPQRIPLSREREGRLDEAVQHAAAETNARPAALVDAHGAEGEPAAGAGARAHADEEGAHCGGIEIHQ